VIVSKILTTSLPGGLGEPSLCSWATKAEKPSLSYKRSIVVIRFLLVNPFSLSQTRSLVLPS